MLSRWISFYSKENNRVLCPAPAARHIIGQFGDESFQAITCTGTDNSKQTRKYSKNTKQTNWT